MSNRTTAVHRESTGITCPMCDTDGWPSSLRTQGFAAHCGTAWDNDGFLREAHTCTIIAGLRLELATLQMRSAA